MNEHLANSEIDTLREDLAARDARIAELEAKLAEAEYLLVRAYSE